jgi:8-oxo-dGTP diphosphatase
MREEIDVVAAILWRNGRFLAVKRPEGKPMAGYWEFPGGKVEPGESLEAALERELDEELGLAASSGGKFAEKSHAYDHAKVRLHFMQVEKWHGEPRALENQAMAWLTPEEAKSKRFLPADAEVLQALAREVDG